MSNHFAEERDRRRKRWLVRLPVIVAIALVMLFIVRTCQDHRP